MAVAITPGQEWEGLCAGHWPSEFCPMLGAQMEASLGPEDLVICFDFQASPLLADTCPPESGA